MPRVIRRSDYDTNWQQHGDQYGIDMSTGSTFDLRSVHWVGTRAQAQEALANIESGMDAAAAVFEVIGYPW